jgi:hypothetical protein
MAVYRVRGRWYVKVMRNGIYYHGRGGYSTKEEAVSQNLILKSRTKKTWFDSKTGKWSRAYKEKALAHYSKDGIIRCACCGESNIEFLTLDHINGGGHADRKKIGSGQKLYRYLIGHNFPKEFELQILCFNCNCARRDGVCPHQRGKKGG